MARLAALATALGITAVLVGFAGPTGDAGCRDDPHPGVPPSDHWAQARWWPPVWACRYQLLDGDAVLWRDERYASLILAGGIAALLFAAAVLLRDRPSAVFEGVLMAWVTLAVHGLLKSEGPDFTLATPLLAPPLAALLQHRLGRALRWWWAPLISLAAALAAEAAWFLGLIE